MRYHLELYHVLQVSYDHSRGSAARSRSGAPISAAPDPATNSSTTRATCWGRAQVYSRRTRDTGGKATLRSFRYTIEPSCTNFASSWRIRNRNGMAPVAPLHRIKGTYRVRSKLERYVCLLQFTANIVLGTLIAFRRTWRITKAAELR